jgi:hypothetical protein
MPGGWTWHSVLSKPGYGGGGGYSYDSGHGIHGAPWSGGGGCGGGIYYGDGKGNVLSPGNGGKGIVVVRIRTQDEWMVKHPQITGVDEEETQYGKPLCLCDDPAVRIRHLPIEMTHDDIAMDENCPRTYEEVDHT